MKPIFIVMLMLMLAPGLSHAQDKVQDKIEYAPNTLANVSKIMFKRGVINPTDPIAVEEFTRLAYCGLYPQYGQEDFAWARLQGAIARQIQVDLPKYPDGLEMENALLLDRYDLATNSFLIDEKDKITNMGLLTVYDPRSGSIGACSASARENDFFLPRIHPLRVEVKVDNPLSLPGIPLSRDVADKLIASMNARETNFVETRRNVLMVIKVRVFGLDPLAVSPNPQYKTLSGHIDEILIYEDASRKNLLFKKSFESLEAKTGKN